MKTRDLIAELMQAQADLRDREKVLLRKHGVAEALIVDGMIGATRIAISGEHYAPEPQGKLAFVTPVRIGDDAWSPESVDHDLVGLYGNLVDLVAWHPLCPARWATRCGYGTWLGAIEPQLLSPEPVPIRRSVLSWLRAGGTGLCVLARDPLDVYRTLSLCWKIEAEDRQHQLELHDVLARPFHVPPITIAAPAQPRAA